MTRVKLLALDGPWVSPTRESVGYSVPFPDRVAHQVLRYAVGRTQHLRTTYPAHVLSTADPGEQTGT